MEDELNNVKQFAVILSGETYRIRVSKRDWLFGNRIEINDVAFVATRFVQARTEDEAAAVAIEMVKNGLDEVGPFTLTTHKWIKATSLLPGCPNVRLDVWDDSWELLQ